MQEATLKNNSCKTMQNKCQGQNAETAIWIRRTLGPCDIGHRRQPLPLSSWKACSCPTVPFNSWAAKLCKMTRPPGRKGSGSMKCYRRVFSVPISEHDMLWHLDRFLHFFLQTHSSLILIIISYSKPAGFYVANCLPPFSSWKFSLSPGTKCEHSTGVWDVTLITHQAVPPSVLQYGWWFAQRPS